MLRKLTLRERIGWWIMDRLDHYIENVSDRQWEKLAKRKAELGS